MDSADFLGLMSAWEALAVVLAIAYLLLAIRQHYLCWPAALLSAAIYLVLMYQAGLVMQSALQLFYMAMAVYGFLKWRGGNGSDSGLPITSWGLKKQWPLLLMILIPGLVIGHLLAMNSDTAMPYLDAMVACGAIVTTWMVAQKILQNWHYWFVIDTASIYLYASQGLWLTAALFILYLVLVIIGFLSWRSSYKNASV